MKTGPPGAIGARVIALGAVSVVLASACDGEVVPPPAERFGQIGHIEIFLATPLLVGEGGFNQSLTWKTSGEWILHEEIRYEGRVGDSSTIGSVGDPSRLSPKYAELIVRLHEAPGVAIFIPGLPEGISHDCGTTRTAIEVNIFDADRNLSRSWQQCVSGSLSTMTERGAGPQYTATRLVAAGIQVRDATVGADYRSPYYGSIPFGTLASGENAGAAATTPRLIESESEWLRFWRSIGMDGTPPVVFFDRDYVIAALVGERKEAGQTVHVRNIFQTAGGTVAQMVERVPGDFCSPHSSINFPYRAVVAPRTAGPHEFVMLPTEYVTCDD